MKSEQTKIIYTIVKLHWTLGAMLYNKIADLRNFLCRINKKHPSAHFRSRAHAGLSVFTMGALWRLNALSAWSNQVCIQIKMTDKNIEAQWHFTNLLYCGRLLCIQRFKIKPLGNFTVSESSRVSTEYNFTVEKTDYYVTIYFMPSCLYLYTVICCNGSVNTS